MKAIVECAEDDITPQRLRLTTRVVELEVLDRWLASDHSYFKVRGDDGNVYILRHDDERGWEIVTYDTTGELE